jgi:hypothetical protein
LLILDTASRTIVKAVGDPILEADRSSTFLELFLGNKLNDAAGACFLFGIIVLKGWLLEWKRLEMSAVAQKELESAVAGIVETLCKQLKNEKKI